jgi:membrane-associated protease RseP (regulator of RpoE activity)
MNKKIFLILAVMLFPCGVFAQAPDKKPQLGISVKSLSSAEKRSVFAGIGLLVVKVKEGSPAEQADFSVGDVVLFADGRSSGSSQDLAGIFRSKNIGDAMAFAVIKGKQEQELTLTVGKNEKGGGQGELPRPYLGLDVKNLSAEEKNVFFQDKFLVITRVKENSAASSAGMLIGDVILFVDSLPPESAEKIASLVVDKLAAGGSSVDFTLLRRQERVLCRLSFQQGTGEQTSKPPSQEEPDEIKDTYTIQQSAEPETDKALPEKTEELVPEEKEAGLQGPGENDVVEEKYTVEQKKEQAPEEGVAAGSMKAGTGEKESPPAEAEKKPAPEERPAKSVFPISAGVPSEGE